jgi:hypothetical protein
VDWFVRNPLGFIPFDLFSSEYFTVPWQVGLFGLTLTCILALIVRFRRADRVERAQIKWLLFACFVFGVCYIGAGLASDDNNLRGLIDILFVLSLMALPLAIANAILKYRLFDIDVIIRKTLIYGLLSGFLGLAFSGSVILLQSISTLVLAARSPAVIVISTLVIATLFAPLRNQIQAFIDRRFYRQKYNSEKLLIAFAYHTQSETDIHVLSDHLVEVVNDTMQPKELSLWIKPKK